MVDAEGTCEYVLDPDDPETWDGREDDICYVDDELLNEEGKWSCPYDSRENKNLCTFHQDIDDKDDRDVVEKFINVLRGDAEYHQFIGAKFGDIYIKDVTLPENTPLKLTHAIFGGQVTFDNVVFPSNSVFSQARFHEKVSIEKCEFEQRAVFNESRFHRTVSFYQSEFRDECNFVDAEFLTDETEYGYAIDFSFTEYNGWTNFEGATFSSDATFFSSDFNGYETEFVFCDFCKITFKNCAFSGWANFADTVFNSEAEFKGGEFVSDALFKGAIFKGTIDFEDSEFHKEVDFNGIDMRGARFSNADTRNASFVNADIRNGAFELADLTQAKLFGADMRGAEIFSALLENARIDEETRFLSGNDDDSPHTLSAIRSRPTCLYDPDYEGEGEYEDIDKAKSVYRALEELGRKRARHRLQARSFIRRQDLQRKEYWSDATADDASVEQRLIATARWGRAKIARAVLLYGESPWRVIAWSLGIILSFALLYPLGGWMTEGANEPLSYDQISANFLSEPLGWLAGFGSILVDSLYYSTLTYTALGFGDFQPAGLGRLLTTIETGLGAVMLALLVFILGRRAAR